LALTIALAVVGTILGAFFLWAAWMVDFRITLRRPAKKTRPRGLRRGYAPFRLGEGDRAVLLIHGIAGGPAQMRLLGEALAQEGFAVHGLLLPGHGTDPDDLFHITWPDWYRHVEREFVKLAARYDEVSVVGFSLGAALGVKLAAEHGHRMKRLVLISTPIYFFS
jgi:carboxylesterase